MTAFVKENPKTAMLFTAMPATLWFLMGDPDRPFKEAKIIAKARNDGWFVKYVGAKGDHNFYYCEKTASLMELLDYGFRKKDIDSLILKQSESNDLKTAEKKSKKHKQNKSDYKRAMAKKKEQNKKNADIPKIIRIKVPDTGLIFEDGKVFVKKNVLTNAHVGYTKTINFFKTLGYRSADINRWFHQLS
jgi:hypothetical protein